MFGCSLKKVHLYYLTTLFCEPPQLNRDASIGWQAKIAHDARPQTVALITSEHLGNHIKNNNGGTEPGREGYGFDLGVAV